MNDETKMDSLADLMTQTFDDNTPFPGRIKPSEFLGLWVWARVHTRHELLSAMLFAEVLKAKDGSELFGHAMYGLLEKLAYRDNTEDDESATTTNIH